MAADLCRMIFGGGLQPMHGVVGDAVLHVAHDVDFNLGRPPRLHILSGHGFYLHRRYGGIDRFQYGGLVFAGVVLKRRDRRRESRVARVKAVRDDRDAARLPDPRQDGLGILARERAKGREQERQKQDRAALETVKTVEQVSRDVEGQTEAEQRKGLEGWARD